MSSKLDCQEESRYADPVVSPVREKLQAPPAVLDGWEDMGSCDSDPQQQLPYSAPRPSVSSAAAGLSVNLN